MEGFSSKCIALKVDVIAPKIYCLQAHPCPFQTRNFTGWGSEGVSHIIMPVQSINIVPFIHGMTSSLAQTCHMPVVALPFRVSAVTVKKPY